MNSTIQAKELLASAGKVDQELNGLDKALARAMRQALRRAEHAATGQVKSLERAAFHNAHAMRSQGSKLEEATRRSKAAPESVYERAQEETESSSERLSSQAESIAERLQGHMEGPIDVLADQLDDRIAAMRQRGRERHEKTRSTLSYFAETRFAKEESAKKEGASGKSFLEA